VRWVERTLGGRVCLGLWLATLLASAASPVSAQLAAASATAIPSADASESYVIERGVLVVPATATIYVLARGTGAGIDALDARTLQLRARTSSASLPLLVSRSRLLALAEPGAPLRLSWLDAKTLRVLLRCAPIAVPSWMQPNALDGLGSHFEIRAERAEDAIYVRYNGNREYVGGVPPTPEVRAAAAHDAAGVARVDFQTGTTQSVAEAPPERAPQAYGMEVPYRAGPFVRGPLEITVEVPERDGTIDRVWVTRRLRRDHTALPLLTIAAPSGLVLLSADRSALLISDEGASGTLSSARLIELASGKQLARIPLEQPPQTFVVAGRLLIFATQDTLTAVDLARGGAAHTRALQPTAYRGTYPPSAPAAPNGSL
jgi:hypothetical protein